MSGSEWTAERWCEWLRRNRTQPAPDWRALNDAADAIGKELARLREIELRTVWVRQCEKEINSEEAFLGMGLTDWNEPEMSIDDIMAELDA